MCHADAEQFALEKCNLRLADWNDGTFKRACQEIFGKFTAGDALDRIPEAMT